MVMAEVRKLANGAAARLKMMGRAVEGIDRDLLQLESRRAQASPGEAAVINRRIRELTEAKLASGEILAEGQHQAAQASAAVIEATKAACRDVRTIASEAERAAVRFDQAVADALAALEDIEGAFAPAEGVLLPGSRRFKWPEIQHALLAGFATRRGKLAEYSRSEPMRAQVAHLIRAMRENAAALEKRNFTWGGN